MKLLLIPFLMLAATMTANAHCGTCGTGEAHAEKKACAEGCEKACCAKKAECAKDKAECAKEKCDEPAKKACAEGCTKPCCSKESTAVAAPSVTVASAPLMPCCAKK
ncbi:MAG: hypothetical protein ACSHX8_12150 [Opitutaceae bacterium]